MGLCYTGHAIPLVLISGHSVKTDIVSDIWSRFSTNRGRWLLFRRPPIESFLHRVFPCLKLASWFLINLPQDAHKRDQPSGAILDKLSRYTIHAKASSQFHSWYACRMRRMQSLSKASNVLSSAIHLNLKAFAKL